MGLIARWLASTPHRSFLVYPAVVVLFALIISGGRLTVNPWGVPLLIWGYLQYRLSGRFRMRAGGGGPGTKVPPVRLVTGGPYRHVRNPMYLGHLIFFFGLALTFRSWLGLALFLAHIPWFHWRVLHDEVRLTAIFGDVYVDYMRRTPRWIAFWRPKPGSYAKLV